MTEKKRVPLPALGSREEAETRAELSAGRRVGGCTGRRETGREAEGRRAWKDPPQGGRCRVLIPGAGKCPLGSCEQQLPFRASCPLPRLEFGELESIVRPTSSAPGKRRACRERNSRYGTKSFSTSKRSQLCSLFLRLANEILKQNRHVFRGSLAGDRIKRHSLWALLEPGSGQACHRPWHFWSVAPVLLTSHRVLETLVAGWQELGSSLQRTFSCQG